MLAMPTAETPAPVTSSRYDPADALVPRTPDGYASPAEFHYSVPLLLVGSVALVPIAIAVFGAILWWIQGPAVFEAVSTIAETEGGVVVAVDLGLVFGLLVLAVLVTSVVHELIHGLALERYGYRPSYGVAPHMGAFYAAAFYQFAAREHLLPIALAPLVAISLVGLPLLAVPVPLFALFVFLALVFNATGAVGDLYIVARMLRMPSGTLFYDSDIRHSYVFYPAEPARSAPDAETDGA